MNPGVAAELRARAGAARANAGKGDEYDGFYEGRAEAFVAAASLVESAARVERRCSVCGKVPDGRPCEPASELDEEARSGSAGSPEMGVDEARVIVREWLAEAAETREWGGNTAAVLSYLHDALSRVGEYEQVLTLIATPKRPDGTYNRDREACEQLARAALKGEDDETNSHFGI